MQSGKGETPSWICGESVERKREMSAVRADEDKVERTLERHGKEGKELSYDPVSRGKKGE
jgi:hypothetical protein